MYKIIGADGKQYGPVSADQLRFWIASNRANGQTMAQAEGTSEWRPLNQFAEFSSVLTSTAAPPVLSTGNEYKSKLAAGLFGIFLGGLGVHRFYLGYVSIGVAQIIATLCFGVGIIWGFVEGILILTGSVITTDAEGRPLRD
jgi:TM2 domain-containing membrane protein YozV